MWSPLKCPMRANIVATSIRSTPTASNGVDSLQQTHRYELVQLRSASVRVHTGTGLEGNRLLKVLRLRWGGVGEIILALRQLWLAGKLLVLISRHTSTNQHEF